MEFIKYGKNYLIKGTGRVVSEKEKLQLENRELVFEDVKSNKCQGKTTQRIAKNKKKIKEIMEEENKKEFVEVETYDEKTALKEVQDDTIEETDTII